jgi:hypothetical protein
MPTPTKTGIRTKIGWQDFRLAKSQIIVKEMADGKYSHGLHESSRNRLSRSEPNEVSLDEVELINY